MQLHSPGFTCFIYRTCTCHHPFWPLRTYPEGFAERIRTLYPKLVTGGEGAPQVDDDLTGPAVFAAAPCSTWDEAHLLPSLKYLRGYKYLVIPKEWRDTFPEALEILHKLEQQRLQKNEASSASSH